MASGCDSVDRAVASDARGPLYQSRHARTLIYLLSYVLKKQKKRSREAHLKIR